MPIDPQTVTAPIDPADPKFAALLANLQGNILKSHGRDYAAHVFFRLPADRAASRKLVGALSRYVTSAAEQSAQSAANKAGGSEAIFGALMLSAKGLAHLGFAPPAGFGAARAQPATQPRAVSFAQPMKAAADVLGDDPAIWDDAYRAGDIDGMLLLASSHEAAPFGPNAFPTALLDEAKAAQALIVPSGQVVTVELGRQQRRGADAVEHFGYVDGISQPVMTAPDLPNAAERTRNDPSAGLNLVLVRDPFSDAPDACGSFYVFRKLEQNVSAFRSAEAKLARDLGLADKGLAEGMIVGRFRNGTPVVLSPTAATGPAKENNFNYGTDPGTKPDFPQKCPFHAHIRKTNPRGDIGRQFGPAPGLDDGERARRIARRGMTYGPRDPDLSDAPKGGVGLLFQCYQASIPDQFAFMQNGWANNPGFVRPGATGQDPVIGQGARSTEQTWPTGWGGKQQKSLPDMGQFVFNRGGEFFFAPSVPFLKGLAA